MCLAVGGNSRSPAGQPSSGKIPSVNDGNRRRLIVAACKTGQAFLSWTCAYRLAHEGRTLDRNPVTLPVTGKMITEQYIHEEQALDHLVDWISNRGPGRKE